MHTSLATERAARQKAEEQHLEELRLRVAADQALEKLRGENEALKARITSSEQTAPARSEAQEGPQGEVDTPADALRTHPDGGARESDEIDATTQGQLRPRYPCLPQ
jgi:hypothetical protein